MKTKLLLLLLLFVNAQANTLKISIIKLPSPVVIDGRLNEEVWQNNKFELPFKQRDPIEGAEATEKTEICLAYDESAIYIAARMHDKHPDSILANLERKDNLSGSDAFYVYLDTYADKRTGNYFGINAAGTLYDGIIYNDDWTDNSWEGVWEGKSSIDANGWSAEFRIPFSQLRFHQKESMTWGVNFKREIGRKNEVDFWVYTPKNSSGFVSRFPSLEGIERVTSPGRMEILPYITGKAEYLTHEKGDPFNKGSRYVPGIGADIKYGIGNNLTLDATINPDFGQVEVDPAVVNLSDYETYFQEKRPFFLEGLNIFDFGMGGASSNWNFGSGSPLFFYSRRIGRAPQGDTPDADFSDYPDMTHILGAAKLTGKLGGNWNIGTIHAVTSREYARLDTSGRRFDHEVEPLTYYGVLRAQKEFAGGMSSLGFISTFANRWFNAPGLRADVNRNSLVNGLDGWQFLDEDKTWVITYWGGISHVTGSRQRITSLQRNSMHYLQRPDASHVRVDSNATSMTGFAGRVALNKQKGALFLNASLNFTDPRFDVNDMGFQWRSDVINSHVVVGYRWNEPIELIKRYSAYFAVFGSLDFGRNLTNAGYFLRNDFTLRNYSYTGFWVAYNPETNNNRLTRGGPRTLNPSGWEMDMFYESNNKKKVLYALFAHVSSYSPSSYYSLSGSVTVKPASNVSFSIGPSFERNLDNTQWVDRFSDPYALNTFGNRYVFASLDQKTLSMDLRLNWIFTPSLSLQLFMQPLISANDFYDFKELKRPGSKEYMTYGNEGSSWDENAKTADPDGSGPARAISIGEKDFNYKSLRGSAVLRWEYKPGSTVYLVWTQSRSGQTEEGDFKFRSSLSRLADLRSDNIFMLKFNYWFSM